MLSALSKIISGQKDDVENTSGGIKLPPFRDAKFASPINTKDLNTDWMNSQGWPMIEKVLDKKPFPERNKEIVLHKNTPGQYRQAIIDSAKKYNIPADQLSNLLNRESMGWNQQVLSGDIVSPAGAQGVAQFMPNTVPEVERRGFKFDPLNPNQAIEAAAFYIDSLRKNEMKDLPMEYVYAAYNWGQGNVLEAIKKAGTTEWDKVKKYLPKETYDYVPAVLGITSQE